MLNIKKEEMVIKKVVYRVGIYLSTNEIAYIVKVINDVYKDIGIKHYTDPEFQEPIDVIKLSNDLDKIYKEAKHQINEEDLNEEAADKEKDK
jgi:hypothetical protein